jgi:hypothetical protein
MESRWVSPRRFLRNPWQQRQDIIHSKSTLLQEWGSVASFGFKSQGEGSAYASQKARDKEIQEVGFESSH